MFDTAGAAAGEGTVSVTAGFEASTEVTAEGAVAKGTDDEGVAELAGDVTATVGGGGCVVDAVVVVVVV